jgi:hypothetical protein
MYRPHAGKRLYNLSQKDCEASWLANVSYRIEPH